MPKCDDIENLTISIEAPLLKALDDYCYQHHRKRSDAASLAIKCLLSHEIAKDPAFVNRNIKKSEAQQHGNIIF